MKNPTHSLIVSFIAVSIMIVVACSCSDEECYSPEQNLDKAYEEGAVGCPCTANEADVCVDGVALVCDDDHWLAVEDGPCLPDPPGHGSRAYRDGRQTSRVDAASTTLP